MKPHKREFILCLFCEAKLFSFARPGEQRRFATLNHFLGQRRCDGLTRWESGGSMCCSISIVVSVFNSEAVQIENRYGDCGGFA
jgi:hypothetical protein